MRVQVAMVVVVVTIGFRGRSLQQKDQEQVRVLFDRARLLVALVDRDLLAIHRPGANLGLEGLNCLLS